MSFKKVKRKSYGEACTSANVDTTVNLYCGSSGYAICTGSLFWNSTYCGILFDFYDQFNFDGFNHKLEFIYRWNFSSDIPLIYWVKVRSN